MLLVLLQLGCRGVCRGADLLLRELQFGLEHRCLLVHLRDILFGLLKELLVAQGCLFCARTCPDGERLLPLRLLTFALLVVLIVTPV